MPASGNQVANQRSRTVPKPQYQMVEPGSTSARDSLREYLSSHEIASEIYYPIPLHQQKCFEDLNSNSLPVSERLANKVLSLPNHPMLTENQCENVADLIQEFMINQSAALCSA